MQAESVDVDDYVAHISILKTLQRVFAWVRPYATWMSFYGLAWGFALASNQDKSEFDSKAVDAILAQRGIRGLKFYDGETHRHMFSIPKYLRDALDGPSVGMIITDRELLVVQ